MVKIVYVYQPVYQGDANHQCGKEHQLQPVRQWTPVPQFGHGVAQFSAIGNITEKQIRLEKKEIMDKANHSQI